MNTISEKTERIFALDTLRAIMMLLGIVLHSAVTYASLPMPWPIKSPDHHLGFTALVDFIHVFRMPVFFVVSGFFAALLLFERGPRKMICNRIHRIVFPFIVALILILPLAIMGSMYSGYIFTGEEIKFSGLIQQTIAYISNGGASTIHLWFLYYLAMFCVVFWAFHITLGKLPKVQVVLKHASKLFSRSFKRPRIILYLSLLTFFCFVLMDSISVKTSFAFIPDSDTFLMYILLFTFGWALYSQRKNLDQFQRNDKLFVGVSLILFAVRYAVLIGLPEPNPFQTYFLMAFQAVSIWLLIFGITGLFLRYFNKPSFWGRYISDASYWIYLVHVPIALFLPGLLFKFSVPSAVAFLLIIITTTLLCTLSYELFVREGVVGKFLNGRKYKRAFIKIPNRMVIRID